MRLCRPNKFKTRIALAAFLLLSTALLVGAAAELYIRPPLIALAEKELRNTLVSAVYTGLGSSGDLGGAELVQVTRDAAGRIVFVRSDAVYLSTLAAKLTAAVNKSLQTRLPLTVELPLGAVTGSALLAGTGPLIHLDVIAAAAQQVEIRSEFCAAGINQTKHRIYMHAELHSRLVLPLQKQDFCTTIELPLSEYVIVGAVPDTYVDLKLP